eukprot:scaffold6091_cov164-Amphora_coffeaeformis.AAC.10
MTLNSLLGIDSLGAMFVPPSSPLHNNDTSDNHIMMESHSDTEYELADDEVDELHESSSLKRTMSRSLSGEVIVVAGASPHIKVMNTEHDNKPWVPPEEPHRAVHRIRLSALTHNFREVEAAASRQKCAVITVVKADGYGHGAIATALHLADYCGADSFAVATLEEGIALRKAFAANPPGKWSKLLASMFHTQHVVHDNGSSETAAPSYLTTSAPMSTNAAERTNNPTLRPARIRIIVLGPPVGFPRCFDDYYHHNIEVMVSGPEVAASLMHWVADEAQRKRTAVERAANEAKYAALYSYQERTNEVPAAAPVASKKQEDVSVCTANSSTGSVTTGGGSSQNSTAEAVAPKKVLPHPSSTLGNVQGLDLAREVRSLLLHQHEAKVRNQHSSTGSAAISETNSVDSGSDTSASSPQKYVATAPAKSAEPQAPTLFGGIEAAAKSSRHQEAAAARARAILHEDDDDDDDDNETDHVPAVTPVAMETKPQTPAAAPPARKLRWHALVDSGMGRLGFKTDIVCSNDKTGRRDTVEVLKEMLDLEIAGNAPLEFYGMCTHMADARDLSDYTNSQIGKFAALLKRVRAAGISVPTVSTDNSAALLTTSLKHFDPVLMLSQNGIHTRGYVRTGGAIYGQRPAFKQLKAVSTLLASVRHVAILKKGDTVGYDRAYVAPHDVRIATLTIGFADGYPRELGNGVGKVQIRGAVFPVAGNVCMDMLMVDLGPAHEKVGIGANVVVGDTAVLWGPLDEDVENGGDNQGMVRLQDIAATLKTTQSALTCGLDKMRVRRQFV